MAWTWVPLASRHSIGDEEVRRIREALPPLADELEGGRSLAIHCAAGMHRTGTVAYALLRTCGYPRGVALELLERARPLTRQALSEERMYVAEAVFLPRPHSAATGGGPARSRSRVLVVEEEDDTREMLSDVLAEEGYEVATAPGGMAALEVVQPCQVRTGSQPWESDLGLLIHGVPGERKDGVVKSTFAAADCRAWASREDCTQSARSRTLTLRPQAQYVALQTARSRQTTASSASL